MFEGSKENIHRRKKRRAGSKSLSTEVVAKLKSRGLDPETVTIKELFPEVLDEGGNDLSLMSGAEWEIMVTYYETHKYLIEKYTQAQEESKMYITKRQLASRLFLLSVLKIRGFSFLIDLVFSVLLIYISNLRI